MKTPTLNPRILILFALLTGAQLRAGEIISGKMPKACAEGAECVAACNHGDGDACYHLGLRFSRAAAGHDDGDLAKQYFQLGCDGGSDKSCRQFGEMETTTGKFENWKNGLAALETSCLSGGMNSCIARARLEQICQSFFGCRPSDEPPREEQAEPEQETWDRWMAKAKKTATVDCESGNTEACHRLIELLAPDSAELPGMKNRARAMALADCYGGDAIGCVWLEIDRKSQDVGVDSEPDLQNARDRADEIFQRNCEKDGNWLDCRNYFTHAGGWRANEKGRAEYELLTKREHAWFLSALLSACDRRHPKACLAYAFEADNKTPELTVPPLTLACEAGESQACLWLARKFLYGEGVSKQPEQSLKLYEDQCGAGGCHMLAFYYGEGDEPKRYCRGDFCSVFDFTPLTADSVMQAVPFHADVKLANSYLDRGCRAGDEDCCARQNEGGFIEETEDSDE